MISPDDTVAESLCSSLCERALPPPPTGIHKRLKRRREQQAIALSVLFIVTLAFGVHPTIAAVSRVGASIDTVFARQFAPQSQVDHDALSSLHVALPTAIAGFHRTSLAQRGNDGRHFEVTYTRGSARVTLELEPAQSATQHTLITYQDATVGYTELGNAHVTVSASHCPAQCVTPLIKALGG